MCPTPWYAPAAHRPGHMTVPRLAPSPSDVPLWGLSLLIPSCRPQHHVSMSVHRRGAEGEWTGQEVSRGAVLGNRLPARSPSLLARALQREHLVRSAGVRRKGALCQGPPHQTNTGTVFAVHTAVVHQESKAASSQELGWLQSLSSPNDVTTAT